MTMGFKDPEYSTCPVCGCLSGAYSVAASTDYRVVKCPGCGLEYTTPNPSDEEIVRYYRHYSDIRANSEIVSINAERNLELLRAYGINELSTILDFGCGNGEFVDVAGEHCYGVELSSRSNGGRIFSDIDATPVGQYDFITLWGVLEHLNDPVSTVSKLAKRLRNGGHFVITTVDAESVIPYYYKPPEHLTYWTRRSLNLLLERNGIEIRLVQPYEMCQLSEIYMDRLLSRTPEQYRASIASGCGSLPRLVTVPTNELLLVGEMVR